MSKYAPHLIGLLLLLAPLLCFGPQEGQAEPATKRMALFIGNANYHDKSQQISLYMPGTVFSMRERTISCPWIRGLKPNPIFTMVTIQLSGDLMPS